MQCLQNDGSRPHRWNSTEDIYSRKSSSQFHVLPSVRNATVVLQFYIAVPIIATLLLMFAGLLRLLQTPHDWSTTSSSYAVPTASRSHNASCRKDTVTYALSVMFFFVSSFHLFIMSFYEHRVSWGTGRHSILWLNILFSVKSCSLSPCTGPPIHLLGCALFQHKPSAHILGYIAWYHHWIWILQSANIIVTRTIVVLSLLLLSSTLIIIFIHCFK